MSGWKTKTVGPDLRTYRLATPLLSAEFERFAFALAKSKENGNIAFFFFQIYFHLTAG